MSQTVITISNSEILLPCSFLTSPQLVSFFIFCMREVVTSGAREALRKLDEAYYPTGQILRGRWEL